MISKVLDTNVLVVANGETEQASLNCYECCVIALVEARQDLIVIDDAFVVFSEYKRDVNASGEPGLGDEFLRWLLRNWANPARCELVTLTPDVRNSFAEFPDDPALADFDPSDHKFVAVANASANAPDILNAVDSDWWIHEKALKRNAIKIVHVCEEQVLIWQETKTQK